MLFLSDLVVFLKHLFHELLSAFGCFCRISRDESGLRLGFCVNHGVVLCSGRTEEWVRWGVAFTVHMFGSIRQFLRLFLQDAVTRRTRLLDRRLPFVVNSMGGERVIRQPIRVRMLLLGDVVADDRSTYSITVGQRAGQLMNVLLRTKNSTEFFTATADRIETTAA